MIALIVDDMERNRLLIGQFIGTRGDEALLASSGQEAIEFVKTQAVDYILMDINMPGMDGYETTREIKSIHSDDYLPIIFISALLEEDALEEALAAGGDDYMSKPVRFGVLASKIDAHLRIRELHKKVQNQNKELQSHNLRLEREHELVDHFFDKSQEHSFYDEKVIKTFSHPMMTFNGDTTLVGRRPNGGITILMGDFTGHGLSAAVGTLPVSQIFFNMIEDNAYIGDIASELNRQINMLLPVDMFFAASLIELSSSGDRLTIWHGGMPNAYLYNEESKEVITIESQHMPLGVREQNEFDDAVQLYYVNKNQKLIVMTDGLTEAVNADGQMIDATDYKEAVLNDGDSIEAIVNCYQQYSDGVTQWDDLSVLELTCTEVKRQEQEQDNSIVNDTVPWEFNLHIEDQMLSRDVVHNIIDMIGGSLALRENKGVIYTLLMEMFSNALDHGILGLDGKEKNSNEEFDSFYKEKESRIKELSGSYIDVWVSYVPDNIEPLLKIRMSHNGNEFDITASESSTSDALHGRGIDLIDAISKDALYSDNGRCFSVTMAI